MKNIIKSIISPFQFKEITIKPTEVKVIIYSKIIISALITAFTCWFITYHTDELVTIIKAF